MHGASDPSGRKRRPSMSPAKFNPQKHFWAAALATAAIAVGGCIGGSLASSTGPRPPGHRWSVVGRQMVHVGETVRFDFVLKDALGNLVQPTGLADYCVTYISGERVETSPDITGHFSFSHTFDDVRPGQTVNVKTTAYRQRGQRDFMKIRGKWHQSPSPYELPDRKGRSDSIWLEVYVAPVELTIPQPSDDLDSETGVMRIRRGDGSITSVYIDRPGRPGFTIIGPEPAGLYTVRYLPWGDELNASGTTEVEFTIYDRSGQAHYAAVTLETP